MNVSGSAAYRLNERVNLVGEVGALPRAPFEDATPIAVPAPSGMFCWQASCRSPDLPSPPGACFHERVPRAPVSLDDIDAVIFDLDGVVTKTATIHAAAWKALFDDYLRRRAGGRGETCRPFDIEIDYPDHIDGKPRYDGVAAFLRSRGIDLPYGHADDPPDRETICGLGNRKNDLFHRLLHARGVEIYPSTVAWVKDLKNRGRRIGLVTSSRNGAAIVEAAGLTALFDIRVDGRDLARLGLPGKPAPDLFVHAAGRLGTEPARTAIVEDAAVGVEAGRRGGFGLVIGVDRAGQPDRLRASGADLVVSDLEELQAARR